MLQILYCTVNVLKSAMFSHLSNFYTVKQYFLTLSKIIETCLNITVVPEHENAKSNVFFMSLVRFYFKKTLLSDFWTCLPKVGHIVN